MRCAGPEESGVSFLNTSSSCVGKGRAFQLPWLTPYLGDVVVVVVVE
jgi:hypothetical protein